MYKVLPLLLLTSCLVMNAVYAAESSFLLQAPAMNPRDDASLQRGAKYFVNYCSGCHSLSYIRYNRLARDIGITDAQGNILDKVLQENLMFNTDKVGDTFKAALTTAEGKKWFGVAPPDLTLETRLRGTDWVYGFLKSFYVDPHATWGTNNLVYPGVAMPNILVGLQGEQFPVYKTNTLQVEDSTIEQNVVVGLEPAKGGQLTSAEFDQLIYDIVNFLSYTADPGKVERHQLGVYVLLFLLIFILFAYLLKREYWKDHY